MKAIPLPVSRTVLVLLAAGSLAVALGHRTFHLSSTMKAAAQSGVRAAKVQHLADDAHHWCAPAAKVLPFAAASPVGPIATREQYALFTRRDNCSSDRAPPLS